MSNPVPRPTPPDVRPDATDSPRRPRKFFASGSGRANSPARRARARFRRNRVACGAAWALGLLVVAALAGPWIAPYAPNAFVGGPLESPSVRHWLGTDVHGRDLLVRVLVGARLSLVVGLVGAIISLVIGVL